jgi:hypothetical protein
LSKIGIGFEWPRGRAYEIVEPSLPSKGDPFAATIDEPHIRQTGRTEKENPAPRPLEMHPTLHLVFAQLDGSAEACLHFARNWGLLWKPAEVGAQERLSTWRSEIKTMKATIAGLRRAIDEDAFPSRGAIIDAELDVLLVSGKPDGRPVLSFRPKNLRNAMRIQLAQSIAGGNAISVCPICGAWFQRGGRGGDVKRSIARFCSDKCRNAFHNKQRASK